MVTRSFFRLFFLLKIDSKQIKSIYTKIVSVLPYIHELILQTDVSISSNTS